MERAVCQTTAYDEHSFLSERVQHIFHVATSSQLDLLSDVVDKVGCFNLQCLGDLLSGDDGSYDYFVQSAEKLGPIFLNIEQKLESLRLWKELDTYLKWTSSPTLLKYCYDILKTSTETAAVHSLLISTSVLERSLGNLYLTKGHQCPSMLKDLLATKELSQLLGKGMVNLLRVVMGPPVSLNLRNVLWHGFPSPKEIHKRYGYVILSVAASIGKHLELMNISISDIPKREFVTFPEISHVALTFSMNDLDTEYRKILLDLFKRSLFVTHHFLPFWESAIDLHRDGRYGECVCLLLPQLEHGMRRMFTSANGCEERLLTAENTTLFTTFDEMLNPELGDGSCNSLPEVLGEPFMDLLMDTLVYPEGPRLRDRISHGEADLLADHRCAAEHLICLLAVLSLHELPRQDPLWKEKRLSVLYSQAKLYKSLFHPVAKLRICIGDLVEHLAKWKQLPLPAPEQLDAPLEWDEWDVEKLQGTSVWNLALIFIQNMQLQFKFDLHKVMLPFENTSEILTVQTLEQPSTLYRYKSSTASMRDPSDKLNCAQITSCHSREEEAVKMMCHICKETNQCSVNICHAASERYEQLLNKVLRSRQRKTYSTLLQCMPELACSLRLALVIMVALFQSLDAFNTRKPAQQDSILRLLKLITKYVENLTTYSSIENNRWDDAIKSGVHMTAKLQELLNKYPV